MDINVWNPVFAPTETPVSVVKMLQTEIKKIINQLDIRAQIEENGTEVGGESPEEFAAFARADRARWGRTIKDAKIEPK